MANGKKTEAVRSFISSFPLAVTVSALATGAAVPWTDIATAVMNFALQYFS